MPSHSKSPFLSGNGLLCLRVTPRPGDVIGEYEVGREKDETQRNQAELPHGLKKESKDKTHHSEYC